jgi:hypothetical protein
MKNHKDKKSQNSGSPKREFPKKESRGGYRKGRGGNEVKKDVKKRGKGKRRR